MLNALIWIELVWSNVIVYSPKTKTLRRINFHVPTSGDFSNPEIELTHPPSPALAGRFFTISPPGKYISATWQ